LAGALEQGIDLGKVRLPRIGIVGKGRVGRLVLGIRLRSLRLALPLAGPGAETARLQ
jgi:hypothetical protein